MVSPFLSVEDDGLGSGDDLFFGDVLRRFRGEADVAVSLKRLKGLRVGVVGHVEWADFVRVPHLPRRGGILHVSKHWEEPGPRSSSRSSRAM
jgi:hypothetical protein